MIQRSEVRRIKETYRPGMRIRLLFTEDTQAPPVGTVGTIRGVDDLGSILVAWDTGSGLSVIPEVDEFEIVSGGEFK